MLGWSRPLGLLLVAAALPTLALAQEGPRRDSPAAGDSLLEAAQVLARRGSYQAAERLFRQVIERDPRRQAAYAGLAHSLLKTSQFHQAAQVCTTGWAGAPACCLSARRTRPGARSRWRMGAGAS